MNINDIRLPGQLIADLYRTSLIDTGENPARNTAPLPEILNDTIEGDWKSLGNNQKNILIAVRYANAVHLPDNELEFLTTMLKACKLGLADVAVVNIHGYNEPVIKSLEEKFLPRITMLFAIEPAGFGLPMSFPHYQLQPFGKTTYLCAPSLQDLENDKVEKSKLWVCLKRLFNI